jgi:excisionase family DNA binding protein
MFEVTKNRGFAGGRPMAAQARPAVQREGYITKDEVARRLKKTGRTVENWQRRGFIPFVKVGASVLYRWEDVVAALEARFGVEALINGKTAKT